MHFAVCLITFLLIQYTSVNMQLQGNLNYNLYNDNYDYNHNSLDNFNEDIVEYGGGTYDQFFSPQFPSVDDAIYPYEYGNESPLNSLKAFFEKPENVENYKRTIKETENGKLEEFKPDAILDRNKKSQVLCRVQKTIHQHQERGYEFLPKTYVSYSCHRATPSENILAEGKISEYELCYVSGTSCVTIEKEHWFAKRKQNPMQTNNHCWVPFREAVAVGCMCLPQKNHYK